MIESRGIFGSPDIVIEILSSSNRDHDLVKKFAVYEKFKVKEYWVIDPKNQTITVFMLENEKIELLCQVGNDKKVKSKTFVELDLTFNNLC